MPISAQRIKGKLKREIAAEAFKKLGPDATFQQVDAYFREEYDLPCCEPSMFSAARRKANGKMVPPPRRYRRYKKVNIVGFVARAKELASEMGGWEALEELIQVLKQE